MIDTVVASINQLIHDPEINVIQPIDDIDISEALYVFFEKTYFTPDEINSTIDKLELANKENFRETIRKREIEQEPRRKIKFLKEERIQKINEMVQQSMTDSSRPFTEVAESLKKMYSELPYKVNEADLSEDIEFVIENFKMKPNDIGSFVDLFDLNPDTRNEIKESQKKRIEEMKAIRGTELSIKIERISNLTPEQQEQVMKKVEDLKKRRQENWKQLDVEKLSPLKNRTEKFNAARTRSTNTSEKQGQKSSRDHQR
ncbi:hypothetical protein PFZ81_001992 [Enterococcus hirae]|nr:hypothetical protein [Enterococcus hirae]EMF0231982.1 hypothetical protein [Enterococcus hirae]